MISPTAACVIGLAVSWLGFAEPPARQPQNRVQFPPVGLEYRWFYLDPALAQSVSGDRAPEAQPAAEPAEHGVAGGDEASRASAGEGEPGEGEADAASENGAAAAGIEFPPSAMTLDEGIAAMRETVQAQWPHGREVQTALDDLALYLRSLGADDAGMLFDGRTAAGYGFLRDIAEYNLLPASGTYAIAQSAPRGQEPVAPR